MAGLSDILYGAQIGRTISDPIVSIMREGAAAKRRRQEIEEARKYQIQREADAERRQIEREERAFKNQLRLDSYLHPERGLKPTEPGLEGEVIAEPGAIDQTASQLKDIERGILLKRALSRPLGESGGVPSGTELSSRMEGDLRGLLPSEIPDKEIELESKDPVIESPTSSKPLTFERPIAGTGFSVSEGAKEDAEMRDFSKKQQIADLMEKRDLKKLQEQERIKGEARAKYGSSYGGVTGNKRLDTIRDFADLSGLPSEKVMEEIDSGNTSLEEMASVIGQFKGSRDIPSGEIKSFISWESLDRNFANLEKDIQGLEGEFGPINGNINEFLLKYPVAKQDPRVAEVFAKINSLSASQIHEKYGGALTPGEMARAQRWAVSTNVPFNTLKARIKEARSGIADEKGAFQQTLKARRLRAPELFDDESKPQAKEILTDLANKVNSTVSDKPKKGFKILPPE